MSDVRRAELEAATLSSSGNEITIQCADHQTKDAIFDGLEALAAPPAEARGVEPTVRAASVEGQEAIKRLRSWARSYRESDPQYRFPSDPHAEFFPADMEFAARVIEGLVAPEGQ